MRVPRVGLLVSSCVLGVLFTVGDADAQPQGKGAAPTGPARSSTQFTLRRDEAGGVEAQAARGRARAGDCAGALPAFDSALRTSIDPTIRRDRGLCHENLGHPFPAIEDYRAYLTARPEAPDAEQIRQRLDALEEQTGTGGASKSPVKERDREDKGGGTGASAEASASFSVGSSGASGKAGAASVEEPRPTGSSETYDTMVAREKLAEDAEASPLRYGTGVVLGPFVHLPRFWIGDQADSDLAYGVGAALRYSTGPTVSIISELGYGGIGTSGETSSRAGPLLLGGIELRLPVSRFASDHILLRGGLGYERHVISGTRSVTDNVLGRFALGYRHVFGPAIGLELLADGGPAYVIPENGDSRVNAVIGGSVAFVVGF